MILSDGVLYSKWEDPIGDKIVTRSVVTIARQGHQGEVLVEILLDPVPGRCEAVVGDLTPRRHGSSWWLVIALLLELENWSNVG